MTGDTSFYNSLSPQNINYWLTFEKGKSWVHYYHIFPNCPETGQFLRVCLTKLQVFNFLSIKIKRLQQKSWLVYYELQFDFGLADPSISLGGGACMFTRWVIGWLDVNSIASFYINTSKTGTIFQFILESVWLFYSWVS